MRALTLPFQTCGALQKRETYHFPVSEYLLQIKFFTVEKQISLNLANNTLLIQR